MSTAPVVRPPRLTGGRFALFADCLLVGCLTAVAAVPLVTAYPALVAACAVLRERIVDDRGVGVRSYGRRLGQVIRSGPSVLLVPSLLAGVLALDAVAVAARVPGSWALAVLIAATASVGAVVGLRAAAEWRPGVPWRAVVVAAVIRGARDPGGSALLWLAAGATVAISMVVPVTVALLPGQLALAAVTVHGRAGRDA